ncbi:hypothetical protein J8281_13370 [Aquimarina sp. U1-2]|nr:hypothetical protein [Aquimarina sp. U1-2]MBP2833178.1 hypothetical protein [Aquimarina sp. U1-2]
MLDKILNVNGVQKIEKDQLQHITGNGWEIYCSSNFCYPQCSTIGSACH